METNTNTTDKKNSTWKSWVLGIVLGVGLVVLGTTGIIKDENVNSTLIYVGASQAATGATELNPELASVFDKAADVIDAAIEARTTNPEELIDIITAALKAHTTADVRPVVEAAVIYVNQSYTTSETEAIYHKKLKSLASGFRSGAYPALNAGKDDALDE